MISKFSECELSHEYREVMLMMKNLRIECRFVRDELLNDIQPTSNIWRQ